MHVSKYTGSKLLHWQLAKDIVLWAETNKPSIDHLESTMEQSPLTYKI